MCTTDSADRLILWLFRELWLRDRLYAMHLAILISYPCLFAVYTEVETVIGQFCDSLKTDLLQVPIDVDEAMKIIR